MSIERETRVVTIYQGDYRDRIQHLEQKAEALESAHDDEPRSLMDVPEYVKVAEEHDALVAEAEESALHIKLRAMRRSEWRALKEKHPPRKGNDGDEAIGFNEESLQDEAVSASIVEPADFGADDLDDLADIDFKRLWIAVFRLNAMPSSDPKANLVSRLTQRSDEI